LRQKKDIGAKEGCTGQEEDSKDKMDQEDVICQESFSQTTDESVLVACGNEDCGCFYHIACLDITPLTRCYFRFKINEPRDL
jgi:hypothetical protein